MVEKKLIWSLRARQNLIDTLEFFRLRNRSTTYSEKLYLKIQTALKRVCTQSLIGRPTSKEGVRFIIVIDYMIFYKTKAKSIEVLAFWDTRQDPKKLTY
jgi:plasmid stabilization system protein ParE